MKPTGTALPLFFLAFQFTALGTPELHWLRTYAASGVNAHWDPNGTMDSKGALILVGSVWRQGVLTRPPIPEYSAQIIVKYDSSGKLLWEAAVSGEAAHSQYAVATDAADNVIVTQDFGTTLKYGAGGNLLWKTARTGNPVGVAVDSVGDVFVCGKKGYSRNTTNGEDFLVVKYSAGGTEQWTRIYDGVSHLDDAAVGVVALPGGGIAVTGYTTEPAGGTNFMTIKYNSSGTAEWVMRYDSPEGGEDRPVGLAATLQGEIVVAGISGGKVATIRYSRTGSLLSVNRYEHIPKDNANVVYNGPHTETCYGVAVHADGTAGVVLTSAFIIPAPPSSESYLDTVLLQIDASGIAIPTLLRKKESTYRSSATSNRLAAAPDGFWVANSHEICNVSRQGDIGWTLTDLNLPEQNRYSATFLTIDKGGNVIVGGHDGIRHGNHGYESSAFYALKIGAPPAAVLPSVITGSATNITWGTATLSGTVNPGGRTTSWYFEYGVTTAYGSRTPDQPAGNGNAAVPVTLRDIPFSPGTTNHFRITATNSAGSSTGLDQTFNVPHSPYQLWRIQQFGSLGANGSNPGDDPDEDGIKNLLEYAFATNPKSVAATPLLQPYRFTDSASGFNYLAIDYPVNPLLDDLSWIPEASAALGSWTTASIEVTTLPDNRRRAVARGFQPFMRLRVTLK